MKVTIKQARKVYEVVKCGLSSGLGNPKPGEMCVEAAVCYALGLPHGDNPENCVAQALHKFKIGLNDASGWSSNEARAEGMLRLALSQLGSAGVLDEVLFAQKVALLAINKCVPFALRAAASIHPDKKHQEAMLSSASECEKVGKIENVSVAANSAAY